MRLLKVKLQPYADRCREFLRKIETSEEMELILLSAVSSGEKQREDRPLVPRRRSDWWPFRNLCTKSEIMSSEMKETGRAMTSSAGTPHSSRK
ncbi:hypothetical protein CEXT_798641 [Caerostris extrusa]|uniref:Uncharacterized protein n=1 Tax=Caerostris extrusa TaxID=172846 RepID=A0AAV4Q4C3_CAEEX|nr:hypothetical protein CEXT_798641 [Caerostris extrusa]